MNILGILGVALIVLKLCGVIAWSWWLVTLPLWIIPALILTPIFIAWIIVFWDKHKKF